MATPAHVTGVDFLTVFVDDFPAAVEFYGGVCHMALFKDPDGNQLMLHRRYAPRTS